MLYSIEVAKIDFIINSLNVAEYIVSDIDMLKSWLCKAVHYQSFTGGVHIHFRILMYKIN